MSASVDAMAQAIVEAHRATVGLPISDDSPAQFHHAEHAYRAAKQAARALGFIETDAECVALAWRARTERTGEFDALTWPAEPRDFGLAAHPRHDAFAACPKALGLYAVLPDAAWVGRMSQAGVPTVQLRFKSDDAAAVQREVDIAVDAVRGTGARLFINDHWQIALEEGAWGIHLGQEDLAELGETNLATLRNAGVRLGVSTHGYAEMVLADQVRPSYIAMGAVYPTTLKAMATAPQGVARLMAYADLLNRQQPPYPLVAIGGIDCERLTEVLPSGVGSVAVVRAVLAAADPQAEAQALMQAMKGSAAEA